MTLTRMLALDRDAVICDLAETYGILDYRTLPVPLLSTLATGLRENSRIKLRMAGAPLPQTELLLAAAVDKLAFLAWAKTTDAQRGRNRPPSLVALLTGGKNDRAIQTFASAEDFTAARARLLEEVKRHGN